jgi:hypothetical protein
MMMFIGRGGPIVLLFGGVLFLWWAISGSRPGPSIPGATVEQEKMGMLERLCWGELGAALIWYGYIRLLYSFDPRKW